MKDAVLLAFGTLTVWRVPAPATVDRRSAGLAMLLAPITQLPLLALLATASAAWLAIGGPTLLLAVLLVGAVVLSTRGMHVDGLADTADGLSASFDRQRALAVMKSSDVGPSGVAAVVLALLTQVAGVAALADTDGLALAAVALLVSRQVLAGACHRAIPAAAASGLGQTMAATVSTGRAAGSAVVMLLVALLLGLAGPAWWAGALAVWVGWAAAALVLRHAMRRLGGINGDILGATIEITLAASLTAAALANAILAG